MYWNHNSAYYPWIKKKTADCRRILDVGCGDGTLVLYLDDGKKEVVGIDPDAGNIGKVQSVKRGSSLGFVSCRFEDYIPERQFDAVVFAASIHHMDLTESLQKAKALLTPSGKLLIVGLAKPSTVRDHILEAARVIPSGVISLLHHMRTSEELGIRTSYDLPEMNDLRRIVKNELPGAVIRYALHYRFLLEWKAG